MGVDEAVGDLFVVGVLDAVVVMRNVVAEVLLAGSLMVANAKRIVELKYSHPVFVPKQLTFRVK